MDFGIALKRVKNGYKIAREGWNAGGQFVYYVPADSYRPTTEIGESIAGDDGLVNYRAYFALKTAQGDVATWVPSVSDLLAEDWMTV